MPLPKAETTYPQFSILSLARMVWMHRFGVLLTWGLCIAAVVAVVYRLPAIYTAEALILIDAQKIPERFVPSTVSAETEDRLATISQEILSNTRLKKIMDDYDLYREERKRRPIDEVVQAMRMDISVRIERGFSGNKPDAFRVGYSGKDPALVAQITNQLANLFIEENLRRREGQAEGTSEFISTQVAEAKRKLDSLESAIREYKSRHNGELPEQQNALLGALNRLQMELASNRDAISRSEETKSTTENMLRMAESTLETLQRPTQEAAASRRSSPAVAGGAPAPPRKPSEILENQLDDMLRRYGPAHPDIKRLRVDIATAQAAEGRAAAEQARAPVVVPKTGDAETPAQVIAKTMAGSTADVGQARERIEVLRSQRLLLEKDIQSRKVDQQRILRELATYQASVTNVPLREQELMQITRDYEITKLNYHSLLEKQISAEMSTDMERRQKSERFTIIDPAHVPERPSKPNRLFFSTVGSMFSFVLVLVCAIGLELRKDNLLGEWELPQTVPVLARVPRISMASGSHGFWTGWSVAGRMAAVTSLVLVTALALLAARFYLGHGF